MKFLHIIINDPVPHYSNLNLLQVLCMKTTALNLYCFENAVVSPYFVCKNNFEYTPGNDQAVAN